jgi:hypothetical protein
MSCWLRNNLIRVIVLILFLSALSSCTPDITCPTGQKDAKELVAGAETGKGTEKKRTDNGIIIKKNPKPKKKKR